jgi:hypothetical protein
MVWFQRPVIEGPSVMAAAPIDSPTWMAMTLLSLEVLKLVDIEFDAAC